MTATLSARGQLVIPAPIRKHRHLKPGAKIKFVDTGSAILLIPIPKDPFRAAYGSLKGIVSSEDVIAARREERRREHAR
jgi:AbrB family looped-hinge helix DNA binding protein